METTNLKNTTKKLLSLLGFDKVKLTIQEIEEGINVNIELQAQEAGILIGHQGEAIDAFQLILNLIANHDQPTWKRLSVEIGDYRERRKQFLYELAAKAATSAKKSGTEVVLSSLPSHERRLIHLHFANDPEIETRSEGIGRFRRLVIKAK